MNLGMVGFDFNFVPVHEQLGTEAERLPLERLVDEFNGLIHLLRGSAVGDLTGIKLEVEPADGDGFHLFSRIGARSSRNSLFTRRSSFR